MISSRGCARPCTGKFKSTSNVQQFHCNEKNRRHGSSVRQIRRRLNIKWDMTGGLFLFQFRTFSTLLCSMHPRFRWLPSIFLVFLTTVLSTSFSLVRSHRKIERNSVFWRQVSKSSFYFVPFSLFCDLFLFFPLARFYVIWLACFQLSIVLTSASVANTIISLVFYAYESVVREPRVGSAISNTSHRLDYKRPIELLPGIKELPVLLVFVFFTPSFFERSVLSFDPWTTSVSPNIYRVD